MRNHALKLVGVLFLVMTVALFAPQRAAADDDDPPTRVARLSHTDGSVSFEPAGTEDWVTAVVNRPITTGDKLWADQNSRAELHLGSASIRMGSTTGFSFLNLDDRTIQLQLTEGTLRIRVLRLGDNENFEVDTPNLAFSILRPGIYRINVNQAGDTTVIHVRDGEGEVTGGGEAYTLHGEETGTFNGTDQLNADIEGIGSDDELEDWSEERDRREDHSVARRYVSEDAVGYEDLDEYGGWRDTREYGTIWFPHTTVVGWAPYRYGHWAYIYPWGYTWVEDEPWGFAPFHYGRWVVVGGVWGWVPCRPAVVGVAYVRPVYAPALVAWVGGPHFAIGVSVGGASAVGWFPLGPREVYMPSYPVSRTYVNQVNVTNTTVNTTVVNNYYNNVVVNKNVTVNNVTYVNQRVPGAVTATSTQVMTSGQPVHNNVVRVDQREIARAPVVVAAPAVTPTRQSIVGGARSAEARPPVQIANRAVVAKTTPPPPPPRVEQTIAAVQKNGGRPIAISQARQIEKQEPPREAVRIAPPARPVAPQNNGNQQGRVENNNRPGEQPSNIQPNNNRPNMQPNNNRPPDAQPNNERPNNNDRPNNAQPNNRPPNGEVNKNRPPNAQPNNNRPPNAEPNNNRPPNAQPNDRPNNERPNNVQPNNRPPSVERNDRPPSARPAPPPPDHNPQLEQKHQQELENMRRQQDQERQRLEQQQQQERQRLDQQRADEQRRQQVEQEHQRQLQQQEQKHQQEQQRVEQRQQQEHQQQRQQERQQPPPRPQQQERPAPPPRQQEQPRQQEKPKEKPPKG